MGSVGKSVGYLDAGPILIDKFQSGSMAEKKNPTYYAELKLGGQVVWTFTGKTEQEVQEQIDYYKKTGNFTKKQYTFIEGDKLPF